MVDALAVWSLTPWLGNLLGYFGFIGVVGLAMVTGYLISSARGCEHGYRWGGGDGPPPPDIQWGPYIWTRERDRTGLN